MKIHERIKWARETSHNRFPDKYQKPLTQSDVADAIGVKPQSVQQWEIQPEAGGTTPRPYRLESLAKMFGVSYPWLATGAGDPVANAGVAEPSAPYVVTHDILMKQAMEIADGVESRLGIKVNSDEKWNFIKNVAALLREKYTRDNIPINTAEIIDIAELVERARRGMVKGDSNNEPATG